MRFLKGPDKDFFLFLLCYSFGDFLLIIYTYCFPSPVRRWSSYIKKTIPGNIKTLHPPPTHPTPAPQNIMKNHQDSPTHIGSPWRKIWYDTERKMMEKSLGLLWTTDYGCRLNQHSTRGGMDGPKRPNISCRESMTISEARSVIWARSELTCGAVVIGDLSFH